MVFRDRIIEFIRVPASELAPHPLNWRTHPKPQREALRGVLEEIGLAGAVLARRSKNGRLQLIDGHLRTEELGEQLVPVLVLDVTEAEADKLLATFDPLSEMAGVDESRLQKLLARVDPKHPSVCELFERLEQTASEARPQHARDEIEIRPVHQVVVECADEEQQHEIYQQLTADGFRCRFLML